jgi:DNA-binding XRE family transcriptional regulator
LEIREARSLVLHENHRAATPKIPQKFADPILPNVDAVSSIKHDSCNVYVWQGFFPPNLASMENQYRKRVAKNVRAHRKKMALSQESLAERADMHWTFISGVERGKYNLSLSSLVRIAKALGREPYELLK